MFDSKEKKAMKSEKKIQQVLERFGMQSLTDKEDIEGVRNIALALAGSGASELGALLTNDARAMNRVQTQYVEAIMEQNFIIIRQLDRLNSKLDKLLSK